MGKNNKNMLGERSFGLLPSAMALGLGTAAAALTFGSGIGHADKCIVAGGAMDGSGQGAEQVFADQGRLSSCNEGVDVVSYSGDFWPAVGQQQEKDALAPLTADLTNRLNATPDWQHKRVLAFSESTASAVEAAQQTTSTNISLDLFGPAQGRTGIFNSALYNNVPLVKPIAELIGVDDNNAHINVPAGVDVTKTYTKGDGYANMQPQGIDPTAIISVADRMVQASGHRIPDPSETVVADFVDGDGVHNVVTDDGSSITRTGNNDPAVMNPDFGPEVPPVVAPDFVQQPAPDQAPAPEAAPVDAPAPESVQSTTSSFPGELPCIAVDGSQYFTLGNAPC